MKPRYYIIQREGIFYIYPPSGGEWVAASREKEEAERMQAEKNAALAGSKVLDAEVVEDEAPEEQQEIELKISLTAKQAQKFYEITRALIEAAKHGGIVPGDFVGHLRKLAYIMLTASPEKHAKPQRKRIPRILRPTVTLPEQDWAAVHSVLRIQGRTDVANAEEMLGRTNPYPALDRIKRGLYDIRLAEHIKAQVDAYCKAIRDPQDDDCPF